MTRRQASWLQILAYIWTGHLLWVLAAAWWVVFGLPTHLYRKRLGERLPPHQRRRASPGETDVQKRALSGVVAYLSPLGFLAIAASAVVATRLSSLFPAAISNLIVSFWASGLAAVYMLTLGDHYIFDLSTEIARLKLARAIGLATAVVGGGLLAARFR